MVVDGDVGEGEGEGESDEDEEVRNHHAVRAARQARREHPETASAPFRLYPCRAVHAPAGVGSGKSGNMDLRTGWIAMV